MTEPSIIERVAKAIDSILGGDHESLSIEMGCGKLAPQMRKEAMIEAARAAIAAMREPTQPMLDAVSSFEDISHIDQDPEYYWVRMIDTALKETTP